MTAPLSRFEAALLRRRSPRATLVALGVLTAASACSTTDTSDLAPGPVAGNAGSGGAAGNRGGSGGKAGAAVGGSAGAAGTMAAGAAGTPQTAGSGGSATAGAGGTVSAGNGGAVGAGFGGTTAAGTGGGGGAAGATTGGGGASVTGGAAGSTTGGTSGGGSSAGVGGQAAQAGAAGEAGAGGSGGAAGDGGSAGQQAGGAAGDGGASGQGGTSGGSGGQSGAAGEAGQGGAGGGATGKTVVVRTQHYDGSPSAGVRVRIGERELLSGPTGEAVFDDVAVPYTMYHDAGPESTSVIQSIIIRGFVDLTDLAPVVRVSQSPKFSQRPKVTYVIKAKTTGNTPLAVGQSVCLTPRELFAQSTCANVVAGGEASVTVSLEKQNQPAVVIARTGLNGTGDLIGATRLELAGANGDTVPRDVALEMATVGTFKPSADVPPGYTAQSAGLWAEPNDGLPSFTLSIASTDGTLAQLSKRTLPWLDLRLQVGITATADPAWTATFSRTNVDELLGAKATFPLGEPVYNLPGGATKLGVGGVITFGTSYEDKIIQVRSQGAGQNIQVDPRTRWLIVRTKRSSYTLPALESFHGKWQAGDPGYVAMQGLAAGTPVLLTNTFNPPPDGVSWSTQRSITLE